MPKIAYTEIQNQEMAMIFLQDPFRYYALLTRNHPQTLQSGGCKFLTTDYQNSIWAVMDQGGNIVEEMAYDPWGNRRDATTGNPTYLPGTSGQQSFSGLLYRGYTLHEHLDVFGLINMNGRLYDSQLGRMLSPDNFVQNPSSTQNFNRYSYVLNNPLKYTDPDGEFIVPALIGAGIGIITNGISNSSNGRPFFRGAATAGLIGAFGGAASFGIGQAAAGMQGFGQGAFQTVSHGFLGGTMNAMGGGDFGQGFVSGALGSLAATGSGALLSNAGFGQGVTTVGAGAVAGGLGSKLSGGNFWDGARNGAISAGLNHGIHSGAFGEGLMWASITGRTRHLFSPDALAGTLSLNASAGFNLGAEIGGLQVLRGESAGLYVLKDISYGGGTIEVSITGEFTKLYYSGPADRISPDKFYGPRWETNLSVDVGISLGINAIYAEVEDGHFVIGYGPSVGFGVSPTIVAGNINWGVSGYNAADMDRLLKIE